MTPFCEKSIRLIFSVKWNFQNENHTGCPKKNASKIVWMIYPATNTIDGWDIFHLKDGIRSSVWYTKIFLYDIRKPRNKKIKMGYQNLTILCLEIWCLILFCLYLDSLLQCWRKRVWTWNMSKEVTFKMECVQAS